MGMMSSGLGLGYDRGQYTSGHAPQHGMLRQKSIGEVVCFFRLPLHPPVCLSSGPVAVCAMLTCLFVPSSVSSVANNVCTLSVADCLLYNNPLTQYTVYLHYANKMFVFDSLNYYLLNAVVPLISSWFIVYLAFANCLSEIGLW